MRPTSLLATLATIAACLAPLAGAVAKDDALAKAIASSKRSPNFVARDAARKPQQVLEFIGVKPGQTVVEISPGGGYWTEILAPYLQEKGTYYTAVSTRATENWQKKLDGDKALYGKVKVTDFTNFEGDAFYFFT